jgi:hypothetical protein
LTNYLNALSLAEPIVQSNPTNLEWKILLARLDQKIGEYYALQTTRAALAERATAREKALNFFGKSLILWNQLHLDGGLGADYDGKPAEVSAEVARCKNVPAKQGEMAAILEW